MATLAEIKEAVMPKDLDPIGVIVVWFILLLALGIAVSPLVELFLR